jgi:hypothetical protein
VSEIGKEHRAAMAADLCERAAKMLRDGASDLDCKAVLSCATSAMQYDTPAKDYAFGLGWAGVSLDADRDAAVSAILAGRHPATSLPGQVEQMRRDVIAELRRRVKGGGGPGADQAQGHVEGIDAVLTLLGCKVTP